MRVQEVIEISGSSPATVRRDLSRLEREGLVRREHGTVLIAEPLTHEPFLDVPRFRDWVQRMASEKRRIGLAAAEMVGEFQMIGVAHGTTVMRMVKYLRSRKDLTVVTNALNVAVELSKWKHIKVLVTGGLLSGEWFSLGGPKAIDFVSQHFLDIAFIGVNGIHPEKGITDYYAEHAATHQALLRQARKKVVLADHTKFGLISRNLVCPVRDIDVIITDTGARDDMVAPLLSAGVEVLRV